MSAFDPKRTFAGDQLRGWIGRSRPYKLANTSRPVEAKMARDISEWLEDLGLGMAGGAAS